MVIRARAPLTTRPPPAGSQRLSRTEPQSDADKKLPGGRLVLWLRVRLCEVVERV